MMVVSLTAVHSDAGKNIYDNMSQMIVEIFARCIPSFAYNSDIQRLVSVRGSIQKRFPIIESEEATARYAQILPKVTDNAINQLRTAISLFLRDIIDDEGNPIDMEKNLSEKNIRIHIPEELSAKNQTENALDSALKNFFCNCGGRHETGLMDIHKYSDLIFASNGRLSHTLVHDTHLLKKRDVWEMSNPAYEEAAIKCEPSKAKYVGCAGDRDTSYPPLFPQHIGAWSDRLSPLSNVMPEIREPYKLVLIKLGIESENEDDNLGFELRTCS